MLLHGGLIAGILLFSAIPTHLTSKIKFFNIIFFANKQRYQDMEYRRCGNSGLKLPAVSLGLWHNFGDIDKQENAKNILRTAFDAGITHFDLANNYGPPPGSAEE